MADYYVIDETGETDDLNDLVHDVASQIASDAINAGDQRDFLKSHGWTDEDINERLKSSRAWCEVNDCNAHAEPCKCGAAHCEDHPHLER